MSNASPLLYSIQWPSSPPWSYGLEEGDSDSVVQGKVESCTTRYFLMSGFRLRTGILIHTVDIGCIHMHP